MNKPLARRRVLVVEDEMLILMMIEDMLSDLGCESVVAAGSVEDALAKLGAQAFDIAMLDSNLGGASSDPVAHALAARGVPFFFATGQRNGAPNTAFPDHPVLKKPFTFEDLKQAFDRVLPTSRE
jgi:CheY-like chemotaxis protein